MLLIRGRYDRMVPFEVSIAILNHIADSRLVLLNNCGHWPPHALLAQVIDFELVRGTGAVALEPGQGRDAADKCEPLRLSTLLATQPSRREWLFLPHTCRSQQQWGSAQLGGNRSFANLRADGEVASTVGG